MRSLAVLWRVGVLAAWVGALVVLVVLDTDEATLYVAVGAPLTVLVGVVVDRWWATFVPFAVAAVLVAITLIGGSTCADCADEDGPGLVITLALVLFAVPAFFLLTMGVIFRRLGRFFRHLPADNQHA